MADGAWGALLEAEAAYLHPETGAPLCVVEVQICHAQMLTARQDLPGHVVYVPARVAREMLELAMG